MKNKVSFVTAMLSGCFIFPPLVDAEPFSPQSTNKPICEMLASMANSGKLWSHLLKDRTPTDEERKRYKLDGGLEPRFIYEINEDTGPHLYASFRDPNWGSCSGFAIYGLDTNTPDQAHLPEIEFTTMQENSDDNVDLSEAGATDEMIRVGKNSFVISTYYYFDQKKLKAASIAKDGHVDQICKFSSNNQPKLAIRKAIDRKLCSSISEEKTNPLPWDAEQIQIDLNKDGKKEIVELSVEDSGGGCGSTTINLATSDNDLNRVLTTNTDKLGRQGWWHNRYENDYDVQVFIIGNRPFVLGNSELVSLWGNKKKIWCEFESLVQHHVKTVYQSVLR